MRAGLAVGDDLYYVEMGVCTLTRAYNHDLTLYMKWHECRPDGLVLAHQVSRIPCIHSSFVLSSVSFNQAPFVY